MIPNSVTSIGGSVFQGCSVLTSIIIGRGVKDIGNKMIHGCSKLTDVYCYAETVPSMGGWGGSSNAILHVPSSSVNLYKTTAPWSSFKEVVALTDSDPQPTSINQLKAESNIVSYYSVNGKQLSSPQKGINILKMSNGKTKKVLVK